MGRLFQPLLFVLAKCTRNQLIRHIEFLKAENEILRSRIPKKYIYLKADERKRLLKLGKAIGTSLRHVDYDRVVHELPPLAQREEERGAGQEDRPAQD